MNFSTIVTYVDKFSMKNNDTGEISTYCKVSILVPIAKTDKNPYAFGAESKSYCVKEELYNRFKEILAKGTKINVRIGFKRTYDNMSHKQYYKDYIEAIDDKEI